MTWLAVLAVAFGSLLWVIGSRLLNLYALPFPQRLGGLILLFAGATLMNPVVDWLKAFLA